MFALDSSPDLGSLLSQGRVEGVGVAAAVPKSFLSRSHWQINNCDPLLLILPRGGSKVGR